MLPKPCLALLAVALCLPMAACATTPSQPPKGCDGHHRRPANPNGSILATPEAALVAPPAGAGGGPPKDGEVSCR